MLDPGELADVAERYGVADDQVRSDHLISHVLHGVARVGADGVVFFGGTALARTHLPDGRLSEDVDLYAPSRTTVAATFERRLPQLLRREFPGAEWLVPLTGRRDVDPGVLRTRDRLQVRIQLLAAENRFDWPTEMRPIDVRYSDVPKTTLRVPTRPAFSAMKTVAWADRHAERDLYDLAALADIGAVDGAAASSRRPGHRGGRSSTHVQQAPARLSVGGPAITSPAGPA